VMSCFMNGDNVCVPTNISCAQLTVGTGVR